MCSTFLFMPVVAKYDPRLLAPAEGKLPFVMFGSLQTWLLVIGHGRAGTEFVITIFLDQEFPRPANRKALRAAQV